jgi:hypothetical protein
MREYEIQAMILKKDTLQVMLQTETVLANNHVEAIQKATERFAAKKEAVIEIKNCEEIIR